jgi:predicted  nucleic acid-binding Zn-ribbon protein
MAVEVKELEKRLDVLEQEMWALRVELTFLRHAQTPDLSAMEPLQLESNAIAQRAQVAFQQMGIPERPTMNLAEIQAAMEEALPPDVLTQTVLQMREE